MCGLAAGFRWFLRPHNGGLQRQHRAPTRSTATEAAQPDRSSCSARMWTPEDTVRPGRSDTQVMSSMRSWARDLWKSNRACAACMNLWASASLIIQQRPCFCQRAPGQTSRRKSTSSGFQANRMVGIRRYPQLTAESLRLEESLCKTKFLAEEECGRTGRRSADEASDRDQAARRKVPCPARATKPLWLQPYALPCSCRWGGLRRLP